MSQGQGSVYFAEDAGYVKIGWSARPVDRAAFLKARLLTTLAGTRLDERRLHTRFAHLRESRRGSTEWFRLDDELADFLSSLPPTSSSLVFRRATYYLRPEQIKALKLRAAQDERDLSELVREALDRYLGAP